MEIWHAIVYGAVQGLTEYLPISSSGHLVLLPRFLGTRELGVSFEVFLHFGTLLSTLVYFWKDWKQIFETLPFSKSEKITKLKFSREKFLASIQSPKWMDWTTILAASIPVFIVGFLIKEFRESHLKTNEIVIFTLAAGGLGLFLVDRFSQKARTIESLTVKDAWIVGLFQCLALVPGVSRSGATIVGGRFLGFDRGTAARFSFLISAPVLLAALLFELKDLRELHVAPLNLFIAGFSSFAFGMIAIGGLLLLLKRYSYLSFAIYRIALAFFVWWLL